MAKLQRAVGSCSPTSYYKNCWIRRFPGLYIDINDSQRRGAQLLEFYLEESALKCSRACCLTRNFSCNLAVYHFNTTQDSVNCFHFHCPTLESCILRQKGNVILYNVTKGVDPDLLVFGKYFTSNVRVLPHQASSRLNVSEPPTSDKRQFNWPHVAASGTGHPPACSTSTHPSAPATSHTSSLPLFTPLFISIQPTQGTQDILPASPLRLNSTTLKRSTQTIPTRDITSASLHLTTSASTKRTSYAPQSSIQASSIFPTQTGSVSPPQLTSPTATTVPVFSSLPTSGYTSPTKHTAPATTAWAPSTAYTTSNVKAQTDLAKSTNLNSKVTTTLIPLARAQVNSTDVTSAHTRLFTSQLSSTFATLASHIPTTIKTLAQYITTQPIMQSYTSTTTQPQKKQRSYTTTTWPYTELTNTLSPVSPQTEGDITQSPTTHGLPQVFTTNTTTATEDSSGSVMPTPSTRPHLPTSTNNSLNISLTPRSIMADSQPYPNDTKGYISRNITTGDSTHPEGDGDSTPTWHLAANTILVALATCGTVAFGCCCSVLMAVSWRGRRRRKGRYQTTLRGKRGSMQLIKYVIVRESFPKTGSVL
uniref:MANSC domain-containing protein n=1 Tax=Electrophorus electricus TaxID=8005 RepID=A0A4W4GH22_ELEEL